MLAAYVSSELFHDGVSWASLSSLYQNYLDYCHERYLAVEASEMELDAFLDQQFPDTRVVGSEDVEVWPNVKEAKQPLYSKSTLTVHYYLGAKNWKLH